LRKFNVVDGKKLFDMPRKSVGTTAPIHIVRIRLSKEIMRLERGLGYNVPDRPKSLQLRGKVQGGGRTSLIEEGLPVGDTGQLGDKRRRLRSVSLLTTAPVGANVVASANANSPEH